ncbi:MAG TPA: hypothetical protein H9734_07570 [Candidatus Fusicatenibacter merdavium]|uniref:Uncharacterized protein n=1 Tax=Candidatus Fusicatenibacter merdavium TaxID=2838600 RepID=A0A9D1XE46_9FIRM|nr:hypothetical protein [Candidatus Fusicatenibacter merdavium]
MKIAKYPVWIKGKAYTAEVEFSQYEYAIVIIQTDLYRGMRKMGQKPETTFVKRVPIEMYAQEAASAIKP